MREIKHVICLMLENRSFDNMLGFLRNTVNPVDGLLGENENRFIDGGIPPTENARLDVLVGPAHSHKAVMHQMSNRPTPPFELTGETGYVENYRKRVRRKERGYEGQVMECHPESNVPVLSTLAKEFAVCDKWFSSVPGGTFPNRDFACAGTSFGFGENPKSLRDYVRLLRKRKRNKRKNIFNQLQDANATCKIYYSSTSPLMLWPQLWGDDLFRAMYPLHNRLGGEQNRLLSDIANPSNGELAAFNFVEPDFGVAGIGNSQHPGQAGSASEFVAGEELIASIYNALRANPTLFEKTLFVITYDEHGGLYDHVTPPEAVVPGDGYQIRGIRGASDYRFNFSQYGPRVPTVLVSPHIPRGTVDSSLYDHSSIASTVRKLFAPTASAFTERDKRANTFEGVCTLDTARTGDDLPEVQAIAVPENLVPSEVALPTEGLPLDLLRGLYAIEHLDVEEVETGPEKSTAETEAGFVDFLREAETEEGRAAIMRRAEDRL